jgi:4,5-DOPA dioxygenase extradiol
MPTGTDSQAAASRMPVLYLSHGAPPLADDPTWTRELASWSADLPRPTSILMISAHWEEAPLALSATTTVPLIYDFGGFPQRYYEVTYDAPVTPALAADVTKMLQSSGTPVHHDQSRGLDHGAYVPLVEMFPQADVPVLQMSMPTLDPQTLFDIGRKISPLRDQGTLIVGSGFTTHNMRWFNPGADSDAPAPAASSEFDAWAAETMASADVDSDAGLPGQGAGRPRGSPAHGTLRAFVCRPRGRL